LLQSLSALLKVYDFILFCERTGLTYLLISSDSKRI
jgi:hypothetical protein